jgi:hypothetical protein
VAQTLLSERAMPPRANVSLLTLAALTVGAAPAGAGCTWVEPACGSDGWCADAELDRWDPNRDRPAFVDTAVEPSGARWLVGDYGYLVRETAGGWDFTTAFTAEPFSTVAVAAEGDVWAAGRRGSLARWQGGSSAEPAGETFAALSVADLFLRGPEDVYAWSREALHHFDGAAFWPIEVEPARAASSSLLLTAFPGRNGAMWVAAPGVVARWDGETWTQPIDVGARNIYGGAVTAEGGVWLVGRDHGPSDAQGTALFWDGDELEVRAEAPFPELRAVWAPPEGARDGSVWAGSLEGIVRLHPSDLAEVVVPTAPIRAIDGTDAANVWAVGAGGRAYRFDGERWVAHPVSGDARSGGSTDDAQAPELTDVLALHDGTAWAVGGGRLFRFEELAWRPHPTEVAVHAIGGDRAGGAIWVATDRAPARLVRGEVGERALAEPWREDFRDLFMSADGWGWLVGDAGSALFYNGHRWIGVPTGTDHGLSGVHARAPRDVWVTTDEGEVLHFDGRDWQFEVPASGAWLRGIWGDGEGGVVAVGARGTILRRLDGRWETMRSGTAQDLYSVWGSGPDDVWVSGHDGTVLHFDGERFAPERTGTFEPLYGIGGHGALRWAVGGGPVRGSGFVTQRSVDGGAEERP